MNIFSERFLRRSLRMTALLTLIIGLWMVVYLSPWSALAFVSGSVWSLVNMLFLTALVRSVIIPGEIDKLNVIGLTLIKFPLLYVAGYFLIQFEYFKPELLLAGLSVFLLVVTLKAVGRSLMKLDEPQNTMKKQGALN